MNNRESGHAIPADDRDFGLTPFTTAGRDHRGDPALWEIDIFDPPVRGLQLLAEVQGHVFKMRLQQGQVRVRHGIEDAIALHVAWSWVSHWRGPIRKTRASTSTAASKLVSMLRSKRKRR